MNLGPAVLACTGAFLLGAAELSGQNISGLELQERTKRWSVTADLGVFYDDNNLNSSTDPQASYGIEFAPHVALNLPLARTILKASYDLRLNYYQERADNKTDTEHQFQGTMNHRLSERASIDLSESFIKSSQPEVAGDAQTTFLRGDFAHWRNYFRFDYSLRLAPSYGMAFGIRNDAFDYEQEGFDLATGAASLSASLDRVDTRFHMEGHYYIRQHTRYFAGYQIGFLNFTSDELLGFLTTSSAPFLTPIAASYRNALSHYAYVGGDREFSQRLTGSASLGGNYTDYYNQDFTDLSPYVHLKGSFVYLPGSAFTLGTQVTRTATDSGVGSTGVTRDQLSTIVDLGLRHRIAPRFHATLGFFFQHSVYNGGDFDGQADNSYELVPGADYKLMENLFARIEYRRTQLFSSRPDLPFTRNRITVGIRVAF